MLKLLGRRAPEPAISAPMTESLRISAVERKALRDEFDAIVKAPPAPPATPKPKASGSKKRRRPLWIAVLATMAVVAGGLTFHFTSHPGTLQHKGTVTVGHPVAPAQHPVTKFNLQLGQLKGTWPEAQQKPATEPKTQVEPRTQSPPRTATTVTTVPPPVVPAPAPPTHHKSSSTPTQPAPQQPSSQPSPDQATGSNDGGSVSNTDPQDPNQGQNGTCPPGQTPDGSGGCW